MIFREIAGLGTGKVIEHRKKMHREKIAQTDRFRFRNVVGLRRRRLVRSRYRRRAQRSLGDRRDLDGWRRPELVEQRLHRQQYPTVAASTATVTLGANESANNVYLGNGSGTSGTLELAGNILTITNDLVIGQNGGTGVLNEGGGSFTAQYAYV